MRIDLFTGTEVSERAVHARLIVCFPDVNGPEGQRGVFQGKILKALSRDTPVRKDYGGTFVRLKYTDHLFSTSCFDRI